MTITNPNSISVVIPAYNIEQYIARAIDSVLAQTLLPDEIIVVDDGSTDRTGEIVKSYGEQVRYIYQENAGLSAARNTGIHAAKGQWIALLDGDDKWLPEKIAEQVDFLKRFPELKWVSCNFYNQFPDESHKTPGNDTHAAQSLMATNNSHLSVFQILNNKLSLIPNTMVFHRESAIKVGLFQEGLKYAEDIDFFWKFGYSWSKIGYIEKPLTIYFQSRPGSITAVSKREFILNTIAELFTKHIKIAEYNNHKEDIMPFIFNKMRKWLFINYSLRNFNVIGEVINNHPETIPWLDRYLFQLLISIRPRFTLTGKYLLKLLHSDYKKIQ